MLAQAARQDAAEVLLRGAVRWAVVVRQVEMSDAEVERPVDDLALDGDWAVGTEVLPET